MSFWVEGFWADGFWADDFFEEGEGAPPPGFSLSPTQAAGNQIVHVVVIGVGTNWDADNPFTVQSGPGVILDYVNTDEDSAEFDLFILEAEGTIVIHDSSSGTTFSILITESGVSTSGLSRGAGIGGAGISTGVGISEEVV